MTSETNTDETQIDANNNTYSFRNISNIVHSLLAEDTPVNRLMLLLGLATLAVIAYQCANRPIMTEQNIQGVTVGRDATVAQELSSKNDARQSSRNRQQNITDTKVQPNGQIRQRMTP